MKLPEHAEKAFQEFGRYGRSREWLYQQLTKPVKRRAYNKGFKEGRAAEAMGSSRDW